MSRDAIDRRTALKLTGGSITAATTVGTSGAASGARTTINVGYASESGRQAALDAAADVVREFNFDALTVEATERVAETLSNRSDVRYVEADGTWQALHDSCGNCGTWATNADSACHDGSGASVSVIDTGIQYDHPDYEHVVAGGHACVSCFSLYGCSCDVAWDDDNGHGTHVGGIVHSVAPGADLAGAKVLDYLGRGSYSDIACGIEWTADAGHDVGNLSLGGDHSSTVRDACRYAYNNGVLLVAAAGNDGSCTDCVSYPAAYDTVMAVGAVDCYGNCVDFSSSGPEVEICAPGVDIDSAYPCDSCDSMSGTSMAAPHVSAAGAALMAQGYSNTQARQRLRETADPALCPECDLLNVERATC